MRKLEVDISVYTPFINSNATFAAMILLRT